MLYVWIGIGIIVGVVGIGMLLYVAFNKKSKIAEYKVEDKCEEIKEEEKSSNEQSEQGGQSLELNENGLTLNEDDFDFADLKSEDNKRGNVASNFESDEFNAFSGLNQYDDSAYDFESEFFNDYNSSEDDVKRSEIVDEIHKMSPKMKALILADVLDKKHF